MSNYNTKKELNNPTGTDKCNLSAGKDFVTLKAKFGKLDINKLVNISSQGQMQQFTKLVKIVKEVSKVTTQSKIKYYSRNTL